LRSLALKVADTGTNLRLSWDHQAAGISNRAVLFIKDGSDEHRFELDSRQLGQGSISYWPATRDVNFRLEWTSPSGKLSESVRAIGAPSSAAAAPALVAPPVATALPPAVPAPTVAAPLVAAPVTRAPAERPVEPAVGSKPERQAGAASRQNSRAFTAPASEPVSPPAVHAALPEPPVVFSAAAPPPDRGKDLLKSLTAAPDPALGGTTDTPYHVDAQALPRRGRSIPLIGRRVSRTDYVAPVPLHKSAIPNLPHTDSVREIDVKVYVNPSGKVDYAELVSKVSKADADLAALLLFSARRWEFVPAREGSDPTSGEVILHYRVGK
jgi:hypothetical protein